jgi:hypothetical protein
MESEMSMSQLDLELPPLFGLLVSQVLRLVIDIHQH